MSPPNAEQRKQWNELSGPRWVALQPQLDAQLAPFTAALFDRLAPAPGQRVLDVGCGAGATTLALARAVGPDGLATGADLSAPMLALAAERAAAAGVSNARFLQCDAQCEAIPDAPYDALFSRFGVMFFDDPVAAFAHIGGAMKPGARLAFVCWQSVARNPWVSVPRDAALTVLDEVKMAPPGAPGPFAFADPARVRALLEGAGWADVAMERWETELAIGGGGDLEAATEFLMLVGPTAGALREATEGQVRDVRAAVRAALVPHLRDGAVRLGSATWLVTARWPR